jgi:predicted TIM-barrel fold metal-dependent hydrolase
LFHLPRLATYGFLAEVLLTTNPKRMIWGSNWPPPNERLDKKPHRALLFDLPVEWIAWQ